MFLPLIDHTGHIASYEYSGPIIRRKYTTDTFLAARTASGLWQYIAYDVLREVHNKLALTAGHWQTEGETFEEFYQRSSNNFIAPLAYFPPLDLSLYPKAVTVNV